MGCQKEREGKSRGGDGGGGNALGRTPAALV